MQQAEIYPKIQFKAYNQAEEYPKHLLNHDRTANAKCSFKTTHIHNISEKENLGNNKISNKCHLSSYCHQSKIFK